MGVEKVFHDADYDLRILHRDLGMTVHGLFDTQIAAAFVGARSLGLGTTLETFLGISGAQGVSARRLGGAPAE